jgi:hypothetical protein
MKEPCLMCGAVPEEGYTGLCKKCCFVIKAKNDAFARASARRLEESRAKSDAKVEDDSGWPL